MRPLLICGLRKAVLMQHVISRHLVRPADRRVGAVGRLRERAQRGRRRRRILRRRRGRAERRAVVYMAEARAGAVEGWVARVRRELVAARQLHPSERFRDAILSVPRHTRSHLVAARQLHLSVEERPSFMCHAMLDYRTSWPSGSAPSKRSCAAGSRSSSPNSATVFATAARGVCVSSVPLCVCAASYERAPSDAATRQGRE